MRKALILGHYPPPITGERLCCVHLGTALRGLGWEVQDSTKYRPPTLLASPDIVWLIVGATTSGFLRDACWLRYFRLRRKPVFCYIHNASWRKLLRWGPLLGAGPRGCHHVVLTGEIARSMQAAGMKAGVLPNTLTDIRPSEADPPAAKRLLWLGSVTVAKGFETAYAAYRQLAARDTEWRFDVCGTGECHDRKAQYPGATFHGLVTGAEKRRALEAGGVFILPSRYVNETQPLSIIEAMAFGLPVVASDAGGISQMLTSNNQSGGFSLAQAAEAERYASACAEAVRRYGELSAGARGIFEATFSNEAFSTRLAELLATQAR